MRIPKTRKVLNSVTDNYTVTDMNRFGSYLSSVGKKLAESSPMTNITIWILEKANTHYI